MKIVVTGGLGFIGTNLVNFLLNTNHEISSIDKCSYASNIDYHQELFRKNKNYEILTFDLSDIEKTNLCIKEINPDLIIHLAAESHVDRSIDSSFDFIKSNIIGTYSILEAFRNLENNDAKLVHVSTDEVFGSIEKGKFEELTRYDPSSPYSASKASSDHLVRAWNRTYGLNINITNCSNNFGPFQHKEKLIPKVIECLINRDKIPIYGNGKNVRDWLFVEDHVQALWKVCQFGQKGESYNIGGSSELSNIDIVTKLCNIYDKLCGTSNSSNLINYVSDRPGHDFRYAIDSSKIQKDLDWQPSSNFSSLLEKTLSWFLKNK